MIRTLCVGLLISQLGWIAHARNTCTVQQAVYFVALQSEADHRGCARAQMTFQLYYWMELATHAVEWSKKHGTECRRAVLVEPWFVQQPRDSAVYEASWRLDEAAARDATELHDRCHALGVSSVAGGLLFDQTMLMALAAKHGLGYVTFEQFSTLVHQDVDELNTGPEMHGTCCQYTMNYSCAQNRPMEFYGRHFTIKKMWCSLWPPVQNIPRNGQVSHWNTTYAIGFYGVHSKKYKFSEVSLTCTTYD